MFGCKKICIEERRVLWAVNGPDLARTTRLQMKARKGLNATSGALPLVKEIVRSARAVLSGVALSLLKLPIRWPRRKYVIKKWKCKMVSFLFLEMSAFGLFQLWFYKTCKSAVHVNTGQNSPISIWYLAGSREYARRFQSRLVLQ